MFHNPVLLKESIEGLNINPTGTYIDATFGGGGHSKEILKHLTTGKLFAFDQDEDAIKNTITDDRLIMINQNFRYSKNYMKLYNALPVDGMLADLGVSSHQFDTAERGFSTRFDAPLDMRMDKKSKAKTAANIINEYSEDALQNIFYNYGEIHEAGKLAKLIVQKRSDAKIETVNQLKIAISICTNKAFENKFYAMVFQALRIEVNKEMDALEDLLNQSNDIIKVGGRLVVISYHSLEDRLVKNLIKKGNTKGELEKDFYGNPHLTFKAVINKPIFPTDEEIRMNSRARSAKLRIAEKI